MNRRPKFDDKLLYFYRDIQGYIQYPDAEVETPTGSTDRRSKNFMIESKHHQLTMSSQDKEAQIARALLEDGPPSTGSSSHRGGDSRKKVVINYAEVVKEK